MVKNGSKRKFYNAIKKYGWENFIYGIIEECDSNTLLQREMYYIKKYGTFKCGYNSTLGGDGKSGWKHTEETKGKIAKSNTGKKRSVEQRKLLSEIHKNKPLSLEHRKSISDAHKKTGFVPPSHRNTKWWNDGQISKRSVECPGYNWSPGRLPLGPYFNRKKCTKN